MGNMYKITFKITLLLTLTFFNPVTLLTAPANAQLEDLIGGIVNEALKNNQRKKARKQQQRQINNQRRAQQQQQQAEQARKQREENERKIAFNKRIQVALKTLGFYKAAIDGDFGSGSQKAYSKYTRAFEIPNADYNFADILQIEEHARSGWQSLAEMRGAQRGSFSDRIEFLEASDQGFENRDSWIDANRKGFTSRKEYSNFLASGISDPNEFRLAGQKLERRKRALEFCQTSVGEEKWIEAERNCAFALVELPNDPAVTVSYNRAVREVDRILEKAFDDQQAALDIIQPAEGSARDGDNGLSSQNFSEAQEKLNKTNTLIASVELHRAVGRCETLIQEKSFGAVIDTCSPILTEYEKTVVSGAEINQNIKALTTLVDNAQAELNTLEKAAKIEQQKLAHNAAKERLQALIEEVTLFVSNGNRFEQQLTVAQGLANLRAVEGNPKTELLEAASNSLETLLGKEETFLNFRQTRLTAEKTSKSRALLQTRFNVEKMNAFVRNFVSSNLIDERVGSLLEIGQNLEDVLSDGNEDKLKIINIEAATKLQALGLTSALNEYVYTPDGVEVSREDVADAVNNVELQKATLLKAEKTGQELLNIIGDFAKAGNVFSKPLDIAASMARLRLALGSQDAPKITLEVSKLNEILNTDTAYMNYESALDTAANAGLADTVAEEKEFLTFIEKYLFQYISQNVTDENISDFIVARETTIKTLESASDATLVETATNIRSFLSENGLSENLKQFIQASRSTQVNSNAQTASNGLSVNAVNKYILEGHPADLIVLRNTTANAPNIGKNILGNIIFSDKKATICWAHSKPKIDTSVRLNIQKLRSQGVATLNQEVCTQSNLLAFDLVAFKRGKFLNSSVSLANQIIGMFEENKLVEFALISKQAIDQFDDSNKATSDVLSREIEANLKDGFGIVQVSNSSRNLCITPKTDALVHTLILADRKEKLEISLLGKFSSEQHSLEEAYVLSQRNKCGFIYASAPDLKTILLALQREAQEHSIIPEWVSIEAFNGAKQYLTNAQNASAEELAKLSQEREAGLALEQANAEEAELVRQQKEQELRNTHRDAALGLYKPLGQTISNYVLNGVNTKELSKFNHLTELLESLGSDRWKFIVADSSLVEYGLANWKDRKLPTILLRVFIKSENSIKGEYRTDCMFIGYIVDTEFDVTRDPINVSCEDEPIVAQWLTSRGFKSLWNAK